MTGLSGLINPVSGGEINILGHDISGTRSGDKKTSYNRNAAVQAARDVCNNINANILLFIILIIHINITY